MRSTVQVLAVLAVVAACAGPDEEQAPNFMPEPGVAAPAAPAVFRVQFETSRGAFVVEAHRDWAPNGVDRFHELVSAGFYDNLRFFRVVAGFVAQFGIHGDTAVASAWLPMRIPDDSVAQSNVRGTLTFATAGPNTRTTQLFINFRDNTNLDAMGFSPIARIVEGMEVVDSLHAAYGDGPPFGQGPDQGRISSEGNGYLERDFPQLDFIRTARIVP